MSNRFTNNCQNHVHEFHKAFNHPAPKIMQPISIERAIARSIWTVEEIIEFIQASSSNQAEFDTACEKLFVGIHKAIEKSLKSEFPTNDIEKIVAQADALTDQLYFTFGSAVEMNVDIEPIFDIVQGANMSKLFTAADGTKFAKYREGDGKILKSPSFYQPENLIHQEIEKQINKNKGEF